MEDRLSKEKEMNILIRLFLGKLIITPAFSKSLYSALISFASLNPDSISQHATSALSVLRHSGYFPFRYDLTFSTTVSWSCNVFSFFAKEIEVWLGFCA